MIRLFCLTAISFLFSWVLWAAAEPPKIYVNKNACPYECCTYREWDVNKDTELYTGINGKKMNVVVKAGTKVTAVTGEVHSQPLKIQTKQGKDIYLLTYEGEGYWTVWQDGKVLDGVEQNWTTDLTPKSDWWIQVKVPNSATQGWTKESKNFEDPYGCEGPDAKSDAKSDTDTGKIPVSKEEPATSTSVFPASSLVCNLSVTGIEDKAAFIKFFSELKTAVAAKDQQAIANLVAYPLKVNADPKRFTVKDSAELKKNFKNIFTKNVTDAVVSQDIGNLFCRDQGVMIGSGQVWITQRKDKIGIYVINP